jgi:hypothetical protein
MRQPIIGAAALLLCCQVGAPGQTPKAQPGAKSDQSCVDVSVGSAQSYECLNQQLGALAGQQHRAASSETDAPYSATSPANVTGQFDEAATRNRLGRNFGHSVTPERPATAPAGPFPRILRLP